MNLLPSHVFAVGVALSFSSVTAQTEFKGADAVLRRVSDAQNAEAPTNDLPTILLTNLEAFSKKSAELSPIEAASQWVALLEAFMALPKSTLSTSSSFARLSMESLFRALPHSAAWGSIAQRLTQRAAPIPDARASMLRVLAAVLGSDPQEQMKALESLEEQVERLPRDGYRWQSVKRSLPPLRAALEELAGQGSALSRFEANLGKAEAGRSDEEFASNGVLEIPDLVSLVSEARARELIVRALTTGLLLSIETGEATRLMAAKIALENVAELKKPQWWLITGPDEVALYEALAERFTDKDENFRQQADAIYLLSLVALDRAEEAAQFVTSNKISLNGINSRIAVFVAHGHSRKVASFLRQLLENDPSLPYWENYISLAAREGESASALALLKSVTGSPDLNPEAKRKILQHYVPAVLAVDDVEEGIRALRQIVRGANLSGTNPAGVEEGHAARQLAAAGVEITEEMRRRLNAAAGSSQYSPLQPPLRLAKLGHLLKREDLINEGVAAARAIVGSGAVQTFDYSLGSLVALLGEIGRGPDAEDLLAESLAAARRPETGRSIGQAENSAPALTQLAWIYHRAERHTDVMRLLDAAPDWSMTDLSDAGNGRVGSIALIPIAAKALAKTGRLEEARKAARLAVRDMPNSDRGFEVFVALEPDPIPLLDELAKSDPFEERPLIWKAQVLLGQGKLEAAEKTARAAVAIDPSDGEQGKGDRMRAYAVLAEVLDRQGKSDDAKLMRSAVRAIRLSEDADDFWQAGLLSRAVKMYEEALTIFADAYCIQSRLALRNAEQGDWARAEEHYRRAFELMPESFGRVESHCFGCEGAFSGERAQGIAAKVFSSLAEKTPERAQVFYLLGYLRKSEGRYAEAANHYRKATALDPDYLNAWSELASLAYYLDLSPADAAAAALSIVRLDPRARHARPQFEKIRDLGKAWDAVLSADLLTLPAEKETIYPLAASAKSRVANARALGLESQSMYDMTENVLTSFLRHPVLSSLGMLLDTDFAEE